MRALLFAFTLAAGCIGVLDPGSVHPGDSGKDDTDEPEDPPSSSPFSPTWTYTTPDGFTQTPEEDVAI